MSLHFTFHVAIIGAGLSGLGMALALHAHSIKCTLYEQTPSTGRFAGALMLSPNSLRILDRYGMYARVREQGYNFDVAEIKDSEGNLKDKGFYLGSRELFGYDTLRIYRNTILKELVEACVERGITICYDKKFSEVTAEDDNGVEFRFEDGSTAHAEILIAADGIYSKLRTSLFPQIKAEYNGVLAVCGSVQASSLGPEAPEQVGQAADGSEAISTVTLIEGKNGVGAFLLAPQIFDGSDLHASSQRLFPEQTREQWAELAGDPDFHLSFLREGYEDRIPVIQRAVDNISEGSTFIWPLQTLPKLDRWWSDKSGRIIVIGDAAHAMPPTSGQGANQAFEDGWTLARLLKSVFAQKKSLNDVNDTTSRGEVLNEALRDWHARRQKRIDRILKVTQQMLNLRKPLEEQKKLKDEEVWRSLGGTQNGSMVGDEVRKEEDFKKAVVEQWGWLYCPEDLMRELEEELEL